jgi:CDP-paratose 2-epimerase
MFQRILITGGAGFVGSNLGLALKRDLPGVTVTALDNLKRRGSELNLPRLKAGGVEFLHGDIRNPEDLEAAGEADLILECSAEPSVLAGYGGSPAYLLNTNLVGTINCLEHARTRGAAFIFLSTSRVYPMAPIRALTLREAATRFELSGSQSLPGISPAGIAEDFPLSGARTLYGATKLASELLVAEYGEMYGVKSVINRCGVLTGAWQMGKVDQGFMVLWAARHFFGTKLSYLGYGGTGKQVRDILHVDDLYALLRLQMADLCQGESRHDGQIYNVGGGLETSVSLAELTDLCREATGRATQIDRVPETRVGDIPWYVTDTAKVRAATGWTPKTGVKEIVADITAWIDRHQDTLRNIL